MSLLHCLQCGREGGKEGGRGGGRGEVRPNPWFLFLRRVEK